MPFIGEWAQSYFRIPREEYGQLAAVFNPILFDAEEWVKLALDSGMQYLVVTSKHHDGFAMFHSRVDPYNICDATPFQARCDRRAGRGLRQARAEAGAVLFAGSGLARAERRRLHARAHQLRRDELDQRLGLPRQRRARTTPSALRAKSSRRWRRSCATTASCA